MHSQLLLYRTRFIPEFAHTGPRISKTRRISSQYVCFVQSGIRIYRTLNLSLNQSGIRAIDCSVTPWLLLAVGEGGCFSNGHWLIDCNSCFCRGRSPGAGHHPHQHFHPYRQPSPTQMYRPPSSERVPPFDPSAYPYPPSVIPGPPNLLQPPEQQWRKYSCVSLF